MTMSMTGRIPVSTTFRTSIPVGAPASPSGGTGKRGCSASAILDRLLEDLARPQLVRAEDGPEGGRGRQHRRSETRALDEQRVAAAGPDVSGAEAREHDALRRLGRAPVNQRSPSPATLIPQSRPFAPPAVSRLEPSMPIAASRASREAAREQATKNWGFPPGARTPVLKPDVDSGPREAGREPLGEHRRGRRVAVVELVAAPERLGNERPELDAADGAERGVERRPKLVAEPAQARLDFVVAHAEDERLAEALHEEVERAPAAHAVLEHHDRKRGDDRADPSGHRVVILGGREADLAGARLLLGLRRRGREPLEQRAADEPSPKQRHSTSQDAAAPHGGSGQARARDDSPAERTPTSTARGEYARDRFPVRFCDGATEREPSVAVLLGEPEAARGALLPVPLDPDRRDLADDPAVVARPR